MPLHRFLIQIHTYIPAYYVQHSRTQTYQLHALDNKRVYKSYKCGLFMLGLCRQLFSSGTQAGGRRPVGWTHATCLLRPTPNSLSRALARRHAHIIGASVREAHLMACSRASACSKGTTRRGQCNLPPRSSRSPSKPIRRCCRHCPVVVDHQHVRCISIKLKLVVVFRRILWRVPCKSVGGYSKNTLH